MERRTGLSFDSVMAIMGAIDQMNIPLTETDDILTRQDVKGIAGVMKNNVFEGFLGPNTVSFDRLGNRELSDSLDLGFIVEVQCADGQCGFGKPE